MAWSAENATKAFLHTLKRGNNHAVPDVAEFISALAAGSGARLMVEACGGSVGPISLALATAAHQTGGRVVCILPGLEELSASETFLGTQANNVELVVGDAGRLMLGEYRGADFVLIDCDLDDHDRIFRAAQSGAMEGCGGVVVGYNAFHDSNSWARGHHERGQLRVDLLPVGEGLKVSHVPQAPKRSQWVAMVDQCTGEEHVFRLRSPRRRSIEA